MSLLIQVAAGFNRLANALLALNTKVDDGFTPVTATATPTAGDEVIIKRGTTFYKALVDSMLGGGTGGASFPIDVVAPAIGQEAAVVVDGVWKRTPIASLINEAYPDALKPWDEWIETRFPFTTSPQPALVGAAISSGSSNNASPIISLQDGYYQNGVMLSSSATLNSGYRWLGTHSAIQFGMKAMKSVAIMRHINTTNSMVRSGFHDTTTFAEPTDGVWFDVVNGNVTGCTRANATKYTTSSYALTLNAAYILDIEVNAAGTLATFRVLNALTEEVLWSETLDQGIPLTTSRMTNMGVIGTVSTAVSSNVVIFYAFGFGTPAGYNHARGIRASASVLPSAFLDADWTADPAVESIDIDITTLPDPGSSAITALRYRLDGGAAVALTGTGTGVRTIGGLVAGQAYKLQIQQVSSAGEGQWSDTKTITPTAAGAATAPSAFIDTDWTLTAIVGGLRFGINLLPSDGGSAITALEYTLDGGTNWTAFAGTGTGDRDVTGLPTALQSAEIRAVNSVGAGTPSDTKTATPLAPSSGLAIVQESALVVNAYATNESISLNPVGSGNHLVLMVNYYASEGAPVVTDSNSNDWATNAEVLATWDESANGTRTSVLIYKNIPGNPTSVNASWAPASTPIHAKAIEVSGPSPTIDVASASAAQGTATQWDYAFTSTADNALFLGLASFFSEATIQTEVPPTNADGTATYFMFPNGIFPTAGSNTASFILAAGRGGERAWLVLKG